MQLVSSRVTLQPPKCPSILPQQSLTNPNSFSSFSSSVNSCRKISYNKRNLTVKCRRSDCSEPQQQKFNKPSDPPSFSPAADSSPRVFVGHSVYKGKAALTVSPIAPEFALLDSGAYKIAREGFVLLQFAPAVGVRQYDWTRKQVFSLSVTEIGTLMGLGARDSCEFFHDPNKGKSEEGKVRKVLKAEPLPDGSGHFFNLSVQNKLLNVDESIYIPITKAEFTVLISAFNFILPYLLGWHAFANSIKPEDSGRPSNSNPRFSDFEWNR